MFSLVFQQWVIEVIWVVSLCQCCGLCLVLEWEFFKSFHIVTATSVLIWEMRLCVVQCKLVFVLFIAEVFCCLDPKPKQL